MKELTVVVTAPPQRAPRCYAIIAAALSLSRRKTIEGTEFRAWKGYSSRPSPYSSVLSNRALFPSEHEPHSWHTVNGPSSAHFPRETYQDRHQPRSKSIGTTPTHVCHSAAGFMRAVAMTHHSRAVTWLCRPGRRHATTAVGKWLADQTARSGPRWRRTIPAAPMRRRYAE